MAGGLLYWNWRERGFRLPDDPPQLDHYPPISVLVPCYNESETAIETLTVACAVDYPDFEVIAVNDGSRDNTADILDRLAAELPRLRVVHLAENGGKATASLSVGGDSIVLTDSTGGGGTLSVANLNGSHAAIICGDRSGMQKNLTLLAESV